MKYYAVKIGRNPGIYKTWEECQKEVLKYPGAKYKSFTELKDAKAFLEESSSSYTWGVKENNEVKSNEDLHENINITSNNGIIAYVDGSYNKSDETFSYGIVLIDKDNKQYKYSQRMNDKRFVKYKNVAGEVFGSIQAIRKAIELGYKEIHLHYDYKGIEKWYTGEWKANNELTKGYREFALKANKIIKVKFIKVRAHTGVYYNEMVDKLAKEAKLK